jgi:hypothetical protein
MMVRILSGRVLALALLAVVAALVAQSPNVAHAQERSQRLILKDGSYQAVVKYEVLGDRVHYFSSERYEWEDIPSSMINWDATKKYNDELISGKMRTRLVETPEEKEEREKEEANSPEIAPGLKLPGSGGVFSSTSSRASPSLPRLCRTAAS